LAQEELLSFQRKGKCAAEPKALLLGLYLRSFSRQEKMVIGRKDSYKLES